MRDVGQAQLRRDVAQLLGIHLHTIGHWLTLYEAGGLRPLLVQYVPAGKPLSALPSSWPSLRARSSNPPALPLAKPRASGCSRPLTGSLVIAEIIGVLESFARYAMTAIAHVIISLVSAPGIEVDRRELMVPTAELAREGP
jgi:hypothetical protein